MPPKKQPPRNAFYYFMEEFRGREEARGRFFNTMAEVATAAGPEWQEMSVEQRKPYELLKEEHKTKNKEKKYTNLGEAITTVQKREEDGQREKKLMIQNIEDVVADGSSYVTKSFFIAHVNHYCYCNAQNRHIPAEISIVQFTLKDGVDLEDCFHAILDTGNMPIGYRLAALTVSEESHLIPVPPHEGVLEHISEKNMQKTYASMTELLRKNLGPREYLPPVYVDESNFAMAKDVFKNLYDEYGGDNVFNVIKVYSLSYLFFVLRNAAHSRVSVDLAFPFPTIPQTELEKDVYDYVKGIACEYHNMTDDAFPHCSLSKCIRKVFIICDHTCYDLDIDLIPGRHIPKNAQPQTLESRPASQLSNTWVTVSNNPSRANSRPPSSLSNTNGTRSYASAAIPEQSVTQQAAGPSLVNTSNSNNTAAAPTSIRKPQSTSMAMNFRPQQPPDFANDFPCLGASKSTKPQSAGRGRGRILQQMVNK